MAYDIKILGASKNGDKTKRGVKVEYKPKQQKRAD